MQLAGRRASKPPDATRSGNAALLVAPSDAPSSSRPLRQREAASFLTTDEKRAAAGYDAQASGSGAKHNPYHEELGLFTTPDRAVAPGSTQTDGRVRVAQAEIERDRSSILARFPEATAAQETRWAISNDWAVRAIASVRRLDPNWRPTPEFSESIEGEIRVNEAQAREAEAKLRQLSIIPNTNPNWGVNRLRKELYDRGYRLDSPTDAPGLEYINPDTKETVRIMGRPAQRYRTDTNEKHENAYYYR